MWLIVPDKVNAATVSSPVEQSGKFELVDLGLLSGRAVAFSMRRAYYYKQAMLALRCLDTVGADVKQR
jgi:hypothetical protein